MGCGWNTHGQLGLGYTNVITTPAPIPGSEGVTRWLFGNAGSFAFPVDRMLACGSNINGRYGVGSTSYGITTLTPVALPDDVKGRVDRVVYDVDVGYLCFFTAGRRCFAVGSNHRGELGLGSDEEDIFTPTELPVPVDDITTHERVTIIRSGDTLLACGDNRDRLITADDTPKVTTPTPIDLPGPVVKIIVHAVSIILGGSNIFVQLTDGSWVGRGLYVEKDWTNKVTIFTCSPPTGESHVGWTPVTDEYAAELDSCDSDVMSFARPISNV